MFINFKVYEKYNLRLGDVELLTAIKQKDVSFLINNLEEPAYERFKSLNFIKHVKATKKGEHLYTSLRLASKVLEELEEAEVEEQDKKVFDWLKDHYKKMDKEIGNGAKTLRHIRDFRIKSGIEKNNLLRLCIDLLSNEEFMEFNHKLEFLFFKSPNAFATRFDLEESRLWKYYIKNKERLDKTFEQY